MMMVSWFSETVCWEISKVGGTETAQGRGSDLVGHTDHRGGACDLAPNHSKGSPRTVLGKQWVL